MIFIALMGICNALGGRGGDLYIGSLKIDGRMLWRAIVPGIMAGVCFQSVFVWFAVTAGSFLWYPWGWSFEEMGSPVDHTKYPAWLRWIAYKLYPYAPESTSRDKLRGMFMKGIRGMFDVGTFGLLSFVNPYAMLLWPFTFLQGVVYYLVAKLPLGARAVMVAESVYGLLRGLLIASAI